MVSALKLGPRTQLLQHVQFLLRDGVILIINQWLMTMNMHAQRGRSFSHG